MTHQPFGPPLFMPTSPAQMTQMIAQQEAEKVAAADAAVVAAEAEKVAAADAAAAAVVAELHKQFRSDGIVQAKTKDEWLRERAEIISEASKYLAQKDAHINELSEKLHACEHTVDDALDANKRLTTANEVLTSDVSALQIENASLMKALETATAPVIEAPEDAPNAGEPPAPTPEALAALASLATAPAADVPVLALDGKPADTTPPPPPGPDADGVPADDGFHDPV